MDWWSAQNFCDANNMHMVTLQGTYGLSCPYGKSDYIANSNWGYCCATANGVNQYCGESLSSGLTTLRIEGAPTNNYYWTEDLTNDSCYAFGVNLSGGGVSYNARYYSYYALCVE